MADNLTLPASASVVATDDIGGVHFQKVKIVWGAPDSANDITASAGFPVVQQTGHAFTIQGVQDTATSGTITTASSVVGPLAVTQRNVVTISVNGTYAGVTIIIEASDDGGTTWYPLQCIDNNTGQAAASWVLTANTSYSFDSAIGGYTHLRVRSTAWTSGTANVRLTAQSFAYDPVVAAISQALDVDLTMASVAAANGDLFSIDARTFRVAFLQLTGTWVGTVTFQGSDDGTTWSTINAINASTGVVATTATAVGIFAIPIRTRFVRARVTAYTSGTVTGVYRLSSFTLDPIGTTQVVSGTVTANIGTGSLAAGTNAVGDVGIQFRANATGAATIKHIVSAATTNATNVKASAGRVVGWNFTNTTASVQYVKLHNTAGAPTAGAGVVMTIAIPANGVNNMPVGGGGIGFATGIAYTIVTGAADTDTTATTLNAVIGDLHYA